MTVETVATAILRNMNGINKCRVQFLLIILRAYLSLRGRYTFLNLSRYSPYCDFWIRRQFSRPFNFGHFNLALIERYGGSELVWAFDQSYISKSGKQTPGIGYFWSGCAQSMKRGLEICATAILDIQNGTAFHYQATQTICDQKTQHLRSYYAELIIRDAASMLKVSKFLALDAYFSKKPFVDAVCAAGFVLISRLQSNAVLRYAYKGEHSKGKGAKKKFDGPIDPKNVSTEHFTLLSETNEERVYEGRCHAYALKRWVKVVIFQVIKEGKVVSAFIYFSTDEHMEGAKLLLYYRKRFQMEFNFRDTKQHLGLTHCQSRDPQALNFHFNFILTTLNIAKVAHWLSIPKDKRPPFSIADIKARYGNKILLDKIITLYGKDPNLEINNPKIRELYELGCIAA